MGRGVVTALVCVALTGSLLGCGTICANGCNGTAVLYYTDPSANDNGKSPAADFTLTPAAGFACTKTVKGSELIPGAEYSASYFSKAKGQTVDGQVTDRCTETPPVAALRATFDPAVPPDTGIAGSGTPVDFKGGKITGKQAAAFTPATVTYNGTSGTCPTPVTAPTSGAFAITNKC
jgi:hypothetical protein